MPVVAFAFGSFGDIIATTQLVYEIAKYIRLKDTPSHECAEMDTELKGLSRSLDLAHFTLKQIFSQPESPLAPFIDKQIRAEVVKCHKVMARFFVKIAAPQNPWQKVCWIASQAKELAAFRTQPGTPELFIWLV
ncbi:hypothetical protein B0H13DRAFT_2577028 [Mycena leptocephala]|nr:hypothetical protein B0H13DRAFT_2577028 [Mycena leptocephala]